MSDTEQKETPPAPPSAADLEKGAIEAMDAALSGEATKTEDAPPAEAPPVETPKEDAPPADKKPDEKLEKTEPPKDQADPDDDLKKGMTKRTAERFDHFRNESKTLKQELAPIREQVEKAGLKLEDLPQIIGRHRDAEAVIGEIVKTGATIEDYQLSLSVLGDFTAAMNGDVKAGERALALLDDRRAALAKLLGKEVSGVDVLAEHPDLAQQVGDGELPRARALEIAQLRAQQKLQQQAGQRQQQEAQQTQAQQQARQAAAQRVSALEPTFKTHPRYAELQPQLVAQVQQFGRTLPPEQWEAATLRAWIALTNTPAPQPHITAITNTRTPPAAVAAEPKTAEEAFDLAMKAAMG